MSIEELREMLENVAAHIVRHNPDEGFHRVVAKFDPDELDWAGWISEEWDYSEAEDDIVLTGYTVEDFGTTEHFRFADYDSQEAALEAAIEELKAMAEWAIEAEIDERETPDILR